MYQDYETCNLSITVLWTDKIDRSLMRDLRQDGGKSVSYNCCHLSQVCPGKLAYIQTLLLEDRLCTAEHQPTTILVLYIPTILLNCFGFFLSAINILENKKGRVCSFASVLILACRFFVMFGKCGCACVYQCVIIWTTLWLHNSLLWGWHHQCLLPSRHSFYPTWQNLPLLSLLHPFSFTPVILFYPFLLIISSPSFLFFMLLFNLFLSCLQSLRFTLSSVVAAGVPTSPGR